MTPLGRSIQSLRFSQTELSAQTSTASGTTTSQNFATVGSSHARTETVGALTLEVAGLKSSFHGVGIPLNILSLACPCINKKVSRVKKRRDFIRKVDACQRCWGFCPQIVCNYFVGDRLADRYINDEDQTCG